jgi:hypothetical protein
MVCYVRWMPKSPQGMITPYTCQANSRERAIQPIQKTGTMRGEKAIYERIYNLLLLEPSTFVCTFLVCTTRTAESVIVHLQSRIAVRWME